MRTVITTRDHIQQMAYARPGLQIESTSEAMFLTVGVTTWYALHEVSA